MRAVTAATASDANRKMMPSLVAVAEQLDDLDAEDDRPEHPRRDVEEEAGERVLGDEHQEHAQLDRSEAAPGAG